MFKKIVNPGMMILLILLGVFLVLGGTTKKEHKLEELTIFRGNITDYHVIVEDAMRDGIHQRTVIMELISDKEMLFRPILIIGRYNADNGQFEEIFIREKEKNGYNFTRSRDGWTWNPYPGDKDKSPPFTFEKIACAQKKLHLAMTKVHNNENLYSSIKRH